MKIALFTLIAAFTFTSCSTKNNINSNTSTNFSNLTEELSVNICEVIPTNSTVYITDFVNQSNLKNISQLGFLLANELKVNILNEDCKENISVRTLDLAKSLTIGKRGSHILTRNFKDLKNTDLEDDKKVIVGTYMITHNQLILFTKLIDLKTSNTIASTSTSTILTKEIKQLEGIDINNHPDIYKPLHL